MDIILAIFLGYILRIFIELYISRSSIPTLCKQCRYPCECKKSGKCKHFIPKDNSGENQK